MIKSLKNKGLRFYHSYLRLGNNEQIKKTLTTKFSQSFILNNAEKLGENTDVQVIVSWKDGVGSVTFPRSAKVDEEIFKKIVEESGFKISQIKKSKTNIEELTDVQRLLNKI